MAAIPPPKWPAGAKADVGGGSVAIRPAAVRAAAAFTSPNPTLSLYPPGGRLAGVVLLVIASMTWESVSCGYLSLTSATTPAVSAHAGLVPVTIQYLPSRPWAGTAEPGAATWTDRLSLEKLASWPPWASAATARTPG